MNLVNLPQHKLADSVCVVLVETQESLNIGSVARAMGNLGFNDLRLVAHREFDVKRAGITARSSSGLLESAKLFPSLEDGLADCQTAFGFSARDSENRHGQVLLSEAAQILAIEPDTKHALVFGPEDTGLTSEHLSNCTYQVRIPSSFEGASYNLAQAVLVALYEITRPEWEGMSSNADVELAPLSDYSQLDRLVADAADESGFFRKETPTHIPGEVKNLFRRVRATKQEMAVLMGLFSRIVREFKRSK